MSDSSGSSTASQPSSILFFIAVAVGVVIAIVFVFFSMRYYVRTKMGIYATARLSSTNSNGVVFFSENIQMHTFGAYNNDLQEMRRRRRRYQKKRRLTEEEVDHLFPVRTYKNWLEGGAERDHTDRNILSELKEEGEELVRESEAAQGTEGSSVGQEGDVAPGAEKTPEVVAQQQQVDLGAPHEEAHFDSGSCAICIEQFEDDDLVRGLICGHVFHQECLDPWLIKRKACCPMCKRDYYLKNKAGAAAGAAGAADDATHDAGASSSAGADSSTAQPTTTTTNDDAESFSGYTELQYISLAQRTEEILRTHPEIEDIAKESIKKYLTLKWRIFWVVMGISKVDLLNSAIVSEYQKRRSEDPSFESAVNAQPATTTNNNDDDNNNVNNSHEGDRRRVENMV